jgi:hypothetical protein
MHSLWIAAALMLMPGMASAEVSCDQPLTLDTFAQVQCCFKEGASVSRCLDGEMGRLTKEHGVKPVLKALEEASADPMVDAACHEVGHAIGRAAYLQMGFGEAFHACDGTCHYACYHGILERVFLTPEQVASGQSHAQLEDIEEKIPTLCTPDTVGSDEPMLLAQCFHGLGHGLLYTLDYNLSDALKGCDMLKTEDQSNWCALGVFMESSNAPDVQKRGIRLEDPWYPCNELRHRHSQQANCYNNHTKVLIQLRYDRHEIADLCRSLPHYSGDCFIGLGRDISPDAREGKAADLAAFCNAQGESAEFCFTGAVQALVNFTREPDDAYRLCSQLSAEQASICFRVVNDYWRLSFAKSPAEVAAACERAASGSALCLENTGAPDDPLWHILNYLWEMIRSLWE